MIDPYAPVSRTTRRSPTSTGGNFPGPTRSGSSHSRNFVGPPPGGEVAFAQLSSDGVADPRSTGHPSIWARLIATSRP